MDIALIGLGSNTGYNLYALVLDEICRVIEYIESLDLKFQKQIVSLFKLITESGTPHDTKKYRNLGDNIYELKTRSGARILCFTGGSELLKSLILTHGFKKPHNRILVREKQKALKWRKQFFQEPFNIVGLNMEG